MDDVLATLVLPDHTLGILAVLVAKVTILQSESNDEPLEYEQMISRIRDFFDVCSGEQIRSGSDLFATLCHQFTQIMMETGRAIKGISALIRAIQKVQLHPAQLTSIHSDLCLLSLTAKCVKPALPILAIDVTDISKENGHFDVKYFLQYYYYGGIIYSAVKQFERALYFFQSALTTQSMAVSHIMIEAYKKYLLVSLILHGKVSSLPKYTPQVVSRFIRPSCSYYHDLVLAFNTNSPEEVRSVMARYANRFQADRNEGLVKQVLESLHKKNIQRLTKTFLTLSLTDVASRALIPDEVEAEDRLVNMVRVISLTKKRCFLICFSLDRVRRHLCRSQPKGRDGLLPGQSREVQLE